MLQLQAIVFAIIGLSQVTLGQFDVTRPCSASATQVHEGDMTFLVSQNGLLHGRTERGVTSIQQYRWPNAVVPYTIGSGFTEQDRRLILRGMRHWENNTCIRFRPRTTERDYINYYPGSGGCCSYIGRTGFGQQGVSLGRNCIAIQTVIHEIGHVIGFHHEQSRPDRDQYIRVLTQNIQPNALRQYAINNNINSMGVGYDYNSIMHYNDNFFARQPGLRTMVAVAGDEIVLGHALQLSPLDIIQANNFYQCDTRNPGPPLVPVVIDPPTPPPTLPTPNCGEIVNGLSGVITPPGYPTFRHNQMCSWIIQLNNTRGYRLRITIQTSLEQSSGCGQDYLELRNGLFTTSRRIGGRLCGSGTYVFTTSRGEALIQYRTDGFNRGSGSFNGFRVSYTSIDVDECALGFNRFCAHGCRNLVGSFTCTCRPGFRLSANGETCFDNQECAIDNGGCDHKCTNTPGSFICSCNSGYILQPDRKRCLLPATSSCANSNGGCQQRCTNRAGGVVCSCNAGYALNSDQRTCSDVNECTTNNGGCSQICRNTQGSRVCSCRRGYILASNRIACNDIDECAIREHDCSQGCRNTQGSHECTCNPGYQLSSNRISCTDINECATGSHECSHSCQNTQGSYTCSCPSGFALSSNGRTCQDINECSSNHGCSDTCVNTAGSYRCTCPTGYQLSANQRLCEDINECAQSQCSHSCLNTIGSFVCTCPSGFTLSSSNQLQCIDINECANNPGCSHSCANTPGSFRCTCPSGGYQLGSDRRTCEDINECTENTDGCSHGCQNTVGSFECTCPSGFQLLGNQRTCEDINECSTSSHGCSHVCTNTAGSYACTCPSGYTLQPNLRTCEDINECVSSNNCAHGCTNTVGSYTCSCQDGYQLNSDGQTCSDINECSLNNGGCSSVCINTNGSYTCACNPSNLMLTFDGHTCVNANYQCGGQINANTGTISLPSFPTQPYPSNIDCAWRIELQNTTKAISLAFNSNFDIQDSPSCSSSYVEVRDGDGPNSMLVGRYCGSAAPSVIKSSTNTLYIRFHSSSERTTDIGFSATYSTILLPQENLGCIGRPIFAPVDIGSVGFSTFYNGDAHNCEYQIGNIATFRDMHFRVIYTDLKNCSQGKIEIYSGLGDTKRKITTICSARDAEKTVIHIPDILMTVVYDIKVTGMRGFRAVVRDRCSQGQRPTRDGNDCEDINECLIDNQCDHKCENSIGSFSCSCRSGYLLNRDSRTCKDIDECMSENGGCSHSCTNSDGSFACSCPSTMILGENGKTCKPRPTTQPPTTPTTATPTTRATTAPTTTVPTTTAPTTTTTTTTVTTTTPVTPSPTMNVTLTSTSGTFALPTYPSQPYASNRDYIWIIRLQDVSKAITLTFQSRFDIQDSPSCSASYVEVRDGDGPNSMLVGRYCGSTAPSVITSSTNTLYIRFHSSSNQTTNVGFSASYSTIQLPQAEFTCGGFLFAPLQFGSKNFSTFYNGPSQVCKFLIGNVHSFKNMDIRVLYTDMPGNCSQAKIVVYSGVGSVRKVATICSQEDAEKTVRVEDFLVTLEYHVNIPGLRGFRAVAGDKCNTGFRLARNGRTCEDINECYVNNGGCSHICRNTPGSFHCSCPTSMVKSGTGCIEKRTNRMSKFNITTSTGTITLPDYPNLPYSENSDYVWVIRLSEISKAIEITFQDRFDIEDSPSCSHSYVEVRDGDGPNSMLVGRYCGSTAPSVITSSTNTLYIRFHSSPNQTTNVGFNATFKSVQLAQDKFVCKGILFVPGQFGSESFSTIYNGSPRVCEILIGSSTFRNLDFRVIYTDLPGNCSQAKIEVFQGVGSSAKKVATICSTEDAQNTISLKDFLMTIKYEVNIPGLRGFRASATDTCNPGLEPSRSGTACERRHIEIA